MAVDHVEHRTAATPSLEALLGVPVTSRGAGTVRRLLARLAYHSAATGRSTPPEDTMIGFIVFGLFVGAVARLLKPGRQNLSLLATLGLGLVGSVIGGLVANILGTGSIFELNILGATVAIIASVLLVGSAEAITGKPRS